LEHQCHQRSIQKKDTINPGLARSNAPAEQNICRKTPPPHHAAQPERKNSGSGFFAPKKCVIKLECNLYYPLDISAHRRFQFQLPKTDAPVSIFYHDPGLRSLPRATNI